MTGAHGVEIVSLHDQNVRLEQLRRHSVPEHRIVFVQIHASNRHRSVIYGQYSFGGYPNRPNADPTGLALKEIGLLAAVFCNKEYWFNQKPFSKTLKISKRIKSNI